MCCFAATADLEALEESDAEKRAYFETPLRPQWTPSTIARHSVESQRQMRTPARQ